MEKKLETKKENKSNVTVKTVVLAMLSAVSFVLFLLEFPLFAALGHLKLDFSDIPALFGAAVYGPVAGVVIELVKNILELIFKGMGTQMGFGNLMNFIVGCAYIVPFSLIYRKLHKSNELKGLLLGSVAGVVAIVAIGFAANYFVTPLFFRYFLGIELDGATLWAAIGSSALLNVIKGVMLSIVAFPLLKVLLVRLKKYLR